MLRSKCVTLVFLKLSCVLCPYVPLCFSKSVLWDDWQSLLMHIVNRFQRKSELLNPRKNGFQLHYNKKKHTTIQHPTVWMIYEKPIIFSKLNQMTPFILQSCILLILWRIKRSMQLCTTKVPADWSIPPYQMWFFIAVINIENDWQRWKLMWKRHGCIIRTCEAPPLPVSKSERFFSPVEYSLCLELCQLLSRCLYI